MKLLQKIFSKKLSSQIANKGFGAFIPSTAGSFLSGNCTECGQTVSDFTIFGNALILNENGILKIKCSKCRLSNKIKIKKPDVLRGSINREYILIDLKERIENRSTSWIEMILAWYTNYGKLQDEKKYDEAYSIKFDNTAKDDLLLEDWIYAGFEYEVPIKKVFGNIEMLRSCGECGAFWSNNYIKEKIPDLIREGVCWACGIPHEFQWNMRTSLKKEIRKLKRNPSI